MLRKIIFPLTLGIGGVAVLLWLGFWQMHRLDWKQAILADLDTRLSAAPVQLPEMPDPVADAYRAVTFQGRPEGRELHVLVSGTAGGTGYRVITAFATDSGRRILLDKGLLPLDAKDSPAPEVAIAVTGNMIWPDDQNSSTPEPDLSKNIWFARNVETMSAALGTEPLMVVASNITPPDPRLVLLPVDTSGIKNDHWEYAVTWFSLAAVWAAMTGFLILRTTRPKDV